MYPAAACLLFVLVNASLIPKAPVTSLLSAPQLVTWQSLSRSDLKVEFQQHDPADA